MNRDRLPSNPDHLAFGDKPLEWRLPTSEGVTWRLATRDDLPELRRLWAEMDARMGVKNDKPDPFAEPVVLTLVAVDAVTGRIDSALYGELVVDWAMIGTSRRTARTINELIPHLALFLFPRSIRAARVLVPRRLERHMAKLVPRLRNITESFAQFAYIIRV